MLPQVSWADRDEPQPLGLRSGSRVWTALAYSGTMCHLIPVRGTQKRKLMDRDQFSDQVVHIQADFSTPFPKLSTGTWEMSFPRGGRGLDALVGEKDEEAESVF